MTAIDVKHLKFSYKNKKIFDDISFSVADKKWNSFYGSSRSGKTLISNILCGNVRAFGYININRKYLCDNTISLKKKEVYLISINSILYFAGNTLYDELLLSGASVLDIDEGITFFGLSNYKYKSFKDVPIDKKILVLILQSFLVKSKIVLLDNVLCYLKQEDKDKVYTEGVYKIGTDIQSGEYYFWGDDIWYIKKRNK